MTAHARRHIVAAAEKLTAARYEELNRILVERQREILNQVQCKIREVRAVGSERDHEVLDPGETSDVDIQEDIEFALIQMKAEMLSKISAALSRVEEGTYGRCCECGAEIAAQRLRALPFAGRCKNCEEAHERAEHRGQSRARRGSSRTSVGLEPPE